MAGAQQDMQAEYWAVEPAGIEGGILAQCVPPCNVRFSVFNLYLCCIIEVKVKE